MTTINHLFADSLQTHMRKRDYTVVGFAEACNVSENTIYKWRRGEGATLDNIAKAAHVLDVHPAALLGAIRVHHDFVQLWKHRPIRRAASGRAR
jgi:transcriptional regulator with XRE-family HTH domain